MAPEQRASVGLVCPEPKQPRTVGFCSGHWTHSDQTDFWPSSSVLQRAATAGALTWSVASHGCKTARQSCDGRGFYVMSVPLVMSWLGPNCQNNMHCQSSMTPSKYVHRVHSENTYLAECTPRQLCYAVSYLKYEYYFLLAVWKLNTVSSSNTVSETLLFYVCLCLVFFLNVRLFQSIWFVLMWRASRVNDSHRHFCAILLTFVIICISFN